MNLDYGLAHISVAAECRQHGVEDERIVGKVIDGDKADVLAVPSDDAQQPKSCTFGSKHVGDEEAGISREVGQLPSYFYIVEQCSKPFFVAW